MLRMSVINISGNEQFFFLCCEVAREDYSLSVASVGPETVEVAMGRVLLVTLPGRGSGAELGVAVQTAAN